MMPELTPWILRVSEQIFLRYSTGKWLLVVDLASLSLFISQCNINPFGKLSTKKQT